MSDVNINLDKRVEAPSYLRIFVALFTIVALAFLALIVVLHYAEERRSLYIVKVDQWLLWKDKCMISTKSAFPEEGEMTSSIMLRKDKYGENGITLTNDLIKEDIIIEKIRFSSDLESEDLKPFISQKGRIYMEIPMYLSKKIYRIMSHDAFTIGVSGYHDDIWYYKGSVKAVSSYDACLASNPNLGDVK